MMITWQLLLTRCAMNGVTCNKTKTIIAFNLHLCFLWVKLPLRRGFVFSSRMVFCKNEIEGNYCVIG